MASRRSSEAFRLGRGARCIRNDSGGNRADSPNQFRGKETMHTATKTHTRSPQRRSRPQDSSGRCPTTGPWQAAGRADPAPRRRAGGLRHDAPGRRGHVGQRALERRVGPDRSRRAAVQRASPRRIGTPEATTLLDATGAMPVLQRRLQRCREPGVSRRCSSTASLGRSAEPALGCHRRPLADGELLSDLHH